MIRLVRSWTTFHSNHTLVENLANASSAGSTGHVYYGCSSAVTIWANYSVYRKQSIKNTSLSPTQIGCSTTSSEVQSSLSTPPEATRWTQRNKQKCFHQKMFSVIAEHWKRRKLDWTVTQPRKVKSWCRKRLTLLHWLSHEAIVVKTKGTNGIEMPTEEKKKTKKMDWICYTGKTYWCSKPTQIGTPCRR